MKTITINIPDDCEVQIVRKKEKKEPTIRTYQDLSNNITLVKGYYINESSTIIEVNDGFICDEDKNVAASEKVAKSMLAMAMISQLIPYYGGEITKEEWKDEDITKYVIYKVFDNIKFDRFYVQYSFLAFHTEEQRDEFLKYNEQLVKDYLMID